MLAEFTPRAKRAEMSLSRVRRWALGKVNLGFSNAEMGTKSLTDFAYAQSVKRLPFVARFRRNRKFLTSATATCCNNGRTVGGAHALAKAVLVAALTIGGLKCTFWHGLRAQIQAFPKSLPPFE